ncbi:hypothetical protein VTJ83DRAFT_4427 [Remersonia thermophila]|uniref:Uncharacterized protein n=1 Tax=Remersonia thermophila TaxID=72144 RepID=A0ABR4DAP2_9PEZI
MCDNGPGTPFCSPLSGTVVRTGETLENGKLTFCKVTWNPLFFSPTSDQPADKIFIQADFLPNGNDNNSPPQHSGITSAALDPSLGIFSWPILDTLLPGNSTSATAVLSIAAPLPTVSRNGSFVRIGAGTDRFPGPSVRLLRAEPRPDAANDLAPSSPPSPEPLSQLGPPPGPSPLAIALPVALGLLAGMLMITYIALRSRRPDLLARICPGRRNKGGRPLMVQQKGYGERQSWAQRTRRVAGREVEIKVMTTDLEGARSNAARMVGQPGFADVGTVPGAGTATLRFAGNAAWPGRMV